ncbi:hypothetical protein PoB_006405900 [Plakobranchus ocellatus]|uniref:Uncharacterized protein n=1 Tax=Plakobranchus ocellatus TaxID=259542 RepID=A0AAV4D026_9GAST|nr:hypothetical protein PoB_006405900 [Plakobranchus ocellatus]
MHCMPQLLVGMYPLVLEGMWDSLEKLFRLRLDVHQLIPARVFKGQNATLKCAFHNIVGKDLLWLIIIRNEALFKVDENGSLYQGLYQKRRFGWHLRAAGSLLFPRNTTIEIDNITIYVLHQAGKVSGWLRMASSVASIS